MVMVNVDGDDDDGVVPTFQRHAMPFHFYCYSFIFINMENNNKA